VVPVLGEQLDGRIEDAPAPSGTWESDGGSHQPITNTNTNPNPNPDTG
jgi:hypothetical protein